VSSKKKLQLNTETIRRLAPTEVDAVGGGTIPTILCAPTLLCQTLTIVCNFTNDCGPQTYVCDSQSCNCDSLTCGCGGGVQPLPNWDR
jgi:hypothetical protein